MYAQVAYVLVDASPFLEVVTLFLLLLLNICGGQGTDEPGLYPVACILLIFSGFQGEASIPPLQAVLVWGRGSSVSH